MFKWAVYPVIAPYSAGKKFHAKKGFLYRFFLYVYTTVAVVLWGVYWSACILFGYRLFLFGAERVGLAYAPVEISGTGSMYPTFPKGTAKTLEEQAKETVATVYMRRFPGGITAFEKTWFRHTLGYGDIVHFKNSATNAILQKEQIGNLDRGFVKRIIGLPGDRIEIRNGFVYRNGIFVEEPYTATPKSTFGGTSIHECKSQVVPSDSVLVMGDNRKASNDSRFDVGFVPIKDISRVLPWTMQEQYHALWRDASKDGKLENISLFSKDEYVTRINALRKEKNMKPLKYDTKLELSAKIRAEVMLQSGDLSFEATASGVTMADAMKRAGYYNTVWGEAPLLGSYTAQELYENVTQFPDWIHTLTDERYQDIGVSTVVGNMNGCPTQIVVQHMAGYVPPNYSDEQVKSWVDGVATLKETKADWQEVTTWGEQYEQKKDAYDTVLRILDEKLRITERIADRMTKREWLTEEDKQLIERNTVLSDELDAAINKTRNQE